MSRLRAPHASALASPIAFPRGMRRPSRAEIEAMVEGLIEYLDAIDGDADLEPSLGSIDATAHSDFAQQEDWNTGGGQDREGPDDNGIADWGGEYEQMARFIGRGGNPNEFQRRFA